MKKSIFLILSIIFLISCSDDDTTTSPSLDQEFVIHVNTYNAIPGISNRNDSGTVKLSLYEDYTLKFDINITNLANSDNLTVAHIHNGDVLSSGGVFAGLVDGTNVSFTGGTAQGTITLTANEATELKTSKNLYVNIHSSDAPSGLVRGQINVEVSQAYNVQLTSSINGRTETGVATLRVVDDYLHYKIEVNDLSSSDEIVAAHIHAGSTGQNGNVVLGFDITSNDDLGVSKMLQITNDDINKLNQDALYVNVHSSQYQAGLIRGQIRD
ncbi:MAG: CHRD domain-containing protein [Tenacibaculum sp.]|nr:CHRD domain-containing protein [Tenacibaculum sp.]